MESVRPHSVQRQTPTTYKVANLELLTKLSCSFSTNALRMAETASEAVKQVVEGVKSVAIGKSKPQKQDKKDKKKVTADGAGDARPLEVGHLACHGPYDQI